MASSAEWDALIVRLRAARDPFECEELATLWEFACAEAPRLLASFLRSGRLDEDRVADLTRNLLVNQLPALLAALEPHAYFKQALHNAACSWLRKKSSALAPGPPEATPEAVTPAPDHAFVLDARDFLLTLSPREHDVLVGLAHGADREELARTLGISRANLDQIVSRLRKRFRGGGS